MMKGKLEVVRWLLVVAIGLLFAMPAVASVYSDAVTTSSPVAWYRMDNANDSALNHDGTVTGGVVFGQPSPLVYDTSLAAAFDGTGVITAANAADLNFGTLGDFSVEAWVRKDGGARGTIVNKGDSAHGYWLRFEDNGTLRFLLDYGTPSDAAQSTQAYNDGQWHHVVGVADRTNSIKLYVDGTMVAADTQINGTGNISSSLNAAIGQLGTNYFGGLMDELAIYNHVVTASQVAAHHAAGTGASSVSYATLITADAPLAWYRMDSSADQMGLLGGTAGTGVAFGQIGAIAGDSSDSALFDNTIDALITVPDDPALAFGTDGDFAIEAWINTTDVSSTIFNKGDTNGGYWMRIEGDGTLRFMLDYGTTSTEARTTSALNDGLWHHVVGVADRDAGVALYVDGVLAVEKAPLGGNDVTSSLDLQIGKLGNGTYLNGELDEVALYDRALGEAEILAHYQAASIPEPSLLALAMGGFLAIFGVGRKR